MSLVLVTQLNLLTLTPAKLIEQTAAKDDAPIADIEVLPVARVGRDAVDGNGLLAVSVATVVLQLVDSVFLGLCNLSRTVVGRVNRVNVVVVSVNPRSLINQIDDSVAVAAKGIGRVIEMRGECILLVLDLGKRILRCGQALGRRRAGCGIGCCLRGIGRVIELVAGILGGGKHRTVHRLQALERRPLPALLGGAFEL